MAIQVGYVSQVNVVDTVGGVFVSSADGTITTSLNTTETATASTTPPTAPPVTKYSGFELTLSSGSGTIDLTSLPGVDGTAGAVTMSGLKPQYAKVRNKSTNANAVTVAKGASNGYTGFGSAFSVTLQPGDEWTFKGNDNSGVSDVNATVKTLDVSGTGSQVLQVLIVGG